MFSQRHFIIKNDFCLRTCTNAQCALTVLKAFWAYMPYFWSFSWGLCTRMLFILNITHICGKIHNLVVLSNIANHCVCMCTFSFGRPRAIEMHSEEMSEWRTLHDSRTCECELPPLQKTCVGQMDNETLMPRILFGIHRLWSIILELYIDMMNTVEPSVDEKLVVDFKLQDPIWIIQWCCCEAI